MEILMLLLLFPILWPLVTKLLWKHNITWGEMSANIGIVAVAVVALFYIGRYAQMSDIEVLNGEVVSKSREVVSCEHSYECNCYDSCSGSGKTRSCTRVCQTCYDHSNDFDWRVKTNVGQLNIARVDRQGVNMPPRFAQTEIGEPASIENNYVNYIKATPESLFHDLSRIDKGLLKEVPPYPKVYDYYRFDHLVNLGVDMDASTQELWNAELGEAAKTLGPTKEANIIVMMADSSNPKFADAVMRKWIGGKKNDIIMVLGTPSYPQVEWAKVFSWSKNDMVNVVLRDAFVEMKQLEPASAVEMIRKNVLTHYERRPMAEFEYLKDEIDPPTWAIWICIIVSILGSLLLSLYFKNNNIKDR